MAARTQHRVVAGAIGILLSGTIGLSQSLPPTKGPAVDGSPAWFLQGSFPDPGGRTIVEPGGRVTVPGRDAAAPAAASGNRGAAPGLPERLNGVPSVKKTVGTASDRAIVVYNIGKDVTSPVVVFNPQPKYTANALRRKVQGTVVMTAVVLPDGMVTNVSVIRSLDRYSLDDVARATAARWRFRPGLRQGVPVAVRVRIALEFKLRE